MTDLKKSISVIYQTFKSRRSRGRNKSLLCGTTERVGWKLNILVATSPAVIIHTGWASQNISFFSKNISGKWKSIYWSIWTAGSAENYHAYWKKELKKNLPYNNLILLVSSSSSSSYILETISDLFSDARILFLIVLFVVSLIFKQTLILTFCHSTFVQNIRFSTPDYKLFMLILYLLPVEIYFLSCKLIFV